MTRRFPMILVLSILIFLSSKNDLFAGKSFDLIKSKILCPFSKSASVWENKFQWNDRISIDENVTSFIDQDLKPFIKKTQELREANEAPIDGVALEAPGNLFGNNIHDFATFFRKVMIKINSHSVDQLQDLKKDENGAYLDDGWQFTFKNERLFIITFAPFYDRNNSRYSYGENDVVIFFQPEYSFKKKLPEISARKSAIKSSVRKRFEKNEQSYQYCSVMTSIDAQKRHEAPRYIKPLHELDDQIIEWWVANDSIHLKETISKFDELAADSACSIQ